MIHYREGYKYQLAKTFTTTVSWHLKPPNGDIETEYIALRRSGSDLYVLLTIQDGYAWDGPSGPTIDTPSAMTGSLIHDAIYQLMREGRLPNDETTRHAADTEYKLQCQHDGMGWFRRWYMFRSLRRFAAYAADPKNKREVKVAP